MALLDNYPSFTTFKGIRYRTDGYTLNKDCGLSSYAWGVPAVTATFTATPATSGGSMADGVYKLYAIYENLLGHRGLPNYGTPVTATITGGSSAGKISLSSLPTSADTQVKWLRVYRTQVDDDGSNGYFYAGRVAIGTTTLELTGDDDSLPITDFLEPGYANPDIDALLNGPYRYAKPIAKRLVAGFDNRLFLGGERAVTTPGTVAVNSGGTVVTGSGTAFSTDYANKQITIDSDTISYLISTASNATQLVISRAYENTTTSSVGYSIISGGSELVFSEQDYPEYFAAINSLLVGEDDGGYITALVEHINDLVVFTNKAIYRIYRTGDTSAPYGVRKTLSSVGCTASRSVVKVDGALFFWSDDGFYMFDGSKSDRMSVDVDDYLHDSVVANMAKYIIGQYVDGKIYWAIPTTASVAYLTKIMVYDTRQGFWDFRWENFRLNDLQKIVDANGRDWLLMSSVAYTGYRIDAFDEASLGDGVGSTDYSGTVTTSSTNTITVNNTALATSGIGLAGCPVKIRRGTGMGQTDWIYTNSTNVITITSTWSTQPDTTSEYTVGAIQWMIESNQETLGAPHDEKTFMNLDIGFIPNPD